MDELKGIKGKFRIQKNTSSNLFRYTSQSRSGSESVSLADFNHILLLDKKDKILEVEGLTTYEQIVGFTLSHGYLPTVCPELKHITVGGATVGIGIESSCFRHGFVHDGLIEADVLLTNGTIVTVNAENEHSDLFFGLPNSYGTLGYILRAKIKLVSASPFVKVVNIRYHTVTDYINAMKAVVDNDKFDFVEGLFYSKDELYLTTGQFVNEALSVKDIYRENIYYKMLRSDVTFYLKTFDYIFRFDPDWFWNVPEGGAFDLFRKYAPKSLRSSKFYNKYGYKINDIRKRVEKSKKSPEEKLIQDWEVPWANAVQFTKFALDNVDLGGKPWLVVPIRPKMKPTSYPIDPGETYFNVGCYCVTQKPSQTEDFYYTKILDRKCFELGGIKMLYSSTFIEEEDFAKIYNGKKYQQLKSKYDPQGRVPDLYEKAVLGQ